MYQVEFNDGSRHDYTANTIAEAMYSEVDDEGNKYLLLNSIIDYRTNATAVRNDNAFIQGKNGNKHRRKTTKGWELLVEWKDGSTSWETLANLKASYPLQVIEFAVQRNIHNEPAFAWWIPSYLDQKKRIINAVKARYLKRTQKFGIDLPRTVEEALKIDKETGTTYWADAIAKERKNNRIAFKFLNQGENAPPGYQYIKCHMNFEIEMDFTNYH
jgi:hypothetical protein